MSQRTKFRDDGMLKSRNVGKRVATSAGSAMNEIEAAIILKMTPRAPFLNSEMKRSVGMEAAGEDHVLKPAFPGLDIPSSDRLDFPNQLASG